MDRKHVRTKDRDWCEVEIGLSKDGRLSITGVEGAARGQGSEAYRCADGVTRRAGGFGQIVETIARFFPEITHWLPYHLNDMQAGCSHQRTAWDPSKPIELVSYTLTLEASQLRTATRDALADAALRGEVLDLTPTARALASLEKWYEYRHTPPDADSPLSGCYAVKKREQKTAGWVYATQHPDGVLLKPCEVCGYRYGSAWLKEELPAVIRAEVETFLQTGVLPGQAVSA